MSPSGPVTQHRTARRLRAVVDAEDCAHHLASARHFFRPAALGQSRGGGAREQWPVDRNAKLLATYSR